MSATQVTHRGGSLEHDDRVITGLGEGDDLRDDDNGKKKKKDKSRRPPNTAFRQQRLKAWQPILTPKTVLPLLFIVGIIFAPIGGVLLYASAQVQELRLDYSKCNETATTSGFTDIPSDKVTKHFKSSNYSNAQPAKWRRGSTTVTYDRKRTRLDTCTLQFDIENDIGPPVFLYYRLTNFYQNHRRYVKSFDQDQLKGEARSNSSIESSDCDPLRKRDGKAIYPCGVIANSIFNDTYSQPRMINGNAGTYRMTDKGIAWDSDKDLYKKSKYTVDQVVPPPNWYKKYPNGYNERTGLPDLHNMENFQVWMRTAGLPTFAKLALRSDNETMKSGRYEIVITNNFPVTEYGGTKSILISTRTVMGGKNPFLGIAFIVVGGLCIALGVAFTALHLLKPRKLGDHTYLNFDQPTAAMTSGRELRPGEADMRA